MPLYADVIVNISVSALDRPFQYRVPADMERKILNLYVQGLSYQEISQAMDKPTKSIDNALQRIKKKLLPRIRSLF